MTVEASGYIVASETAIIGAGDTIHAAAEQALEWLDDYHDINILIADMKQEVQKGDEASSGPNLHLATTDLIRAVEKGGTPEQWTIINDIACTAEEATRHNS